MASMASSEHHLKLRHRRKMFSNPSPEELASWPSPSNHPDKKLVKLLAAQISMSVILTMVVICRFAYHTFITKTFTADDWVLILAYIFTMAFNIVGIVGGMFGWGWHMWDIPPSKLKVLLKILYVESPLFIIANTSIKISILIFYHRILCQPGGSSLWFSHLLKLSIAFALLWGLGFLLFSFFMCTPVRAWWTLMSIPGQVCYDGEEFESYGAINIAVDVYLFVLPHHKIWHLNVPRSSKIAVGVVMSFAALAVAAGAIRMPFLIRNAFTNGDKSWDSMELGIWSTAELTLGITCASAPVFRAIFIGRRAGIRAHGQSVELVGEESAVVISTDDGIK